MPELPHGLDGGLVQARTTALPATSELSVRRYGGSIYRADDLRADRNLNKHPKCLRKISPSTARQMARQVDPLVRHSTPDSSTSSMFKESGCGAQSNDWKLDFLTQRKAQSGKLAMRWMTS